MGLLVGRLAGTGGWGNVHTGLVKSTRCEDSHRSDCLLGLGVGSGDSGSLRYSRRLFLPLAYSCLCYGRTVYYANHIISPACVGSQAWNQLRAVHDIAEKILAGNFSRQDIVEFPTNWEDTNTACETNILYIRGCPHVTSRSLSSTMSESSKRWSGFLAVGPN